MKATYKAQSPEGKITWKKHEELNAIIATVVKKVEKAQKCKRAHDALVKDDMSTSTKSSSQDWKSRTVTTMITVTIVASPVAPVALVVPA